MNNRKSIFTTESKTREEIVQDILAKYPALTLEQVEAALTIETEDRESKPKDTAGEKKSIMSVFSNAKKEENRENKETRFKLPAESVLNRFSGAVKHLEKFIVRIEEAIVRIKADGKDTTVAEGFLTAAKIDLTEAKSHWVEAKTAWDTKADDAREQIKMHLDLMKMEIRSSFENIKASVKALKALREKTQDDSSDDSDDESTDDSGDSSN